MTSGMMHSSSGSTQIVHPDILRQERQQNQKAYQPHRFSSHNQQSITPVSTNKQQREQQRQPQLLVEQHHPDDSEVVYDDDDDDFMMRIVHGSCQGAFSGDNTAGGSLCHIPSCHMSDQLDLLMHCKQPLSFLSFFRISGKDTTNNGDTASIRDELAASLPAGAYMMPIGCEYCGATDTKECQSQHCSRPQLYFQKKRPPFCPPNPQCWDINTDHAVIPAPPPPSNTVVPEPIPIIKPRSLSPFEGSWVSGLFGGNSGSNNNSRVSSPTQITV